MYIQNYILVMEVTSALEAEGIQKYSFAEEKEKNLNTIKN